MRILTITIIITICLTTISCCNQHERAERNACLKDWYGLEHFENLKMLGRVASRRSEAIKASRWGMQFNKYALPGLELMLERMAESGVKWSRVQPDGYGVSPEKGYYQWAELDTVVHGLAERKINVFICFDKESLKGEDRDQPLKPEAVERWLAYVRVLVNRYRDHVKYWEIFNEPKLDENYAELVKNASRTIKGIDPEAKILAGSLARVNVQGLKRVLKHGIGPFIDVITYHPYNEFPEACKKTLYVPVQKPPSYMPGSNLVADLHALLEKEKRPIALWQGECGYPSAENSAGWQGRGPWGERIQAKWLLRRYLTDFSLDIPVSVYFLLCEPSEGDRVNAKGMLHYKTLEPKPSYRALQHFTSLFDNRFDTMENVETHFKVLDEGTFHGVMGAYPSSYYKNKAKAPVPIEVVGLTGSGGYAVAYWLPWRMQEIVKPAKVDLTVKGIRIKEPVLVDLLAGSVYGLKVSSEGEALVFNGVPLADYPMVIVSKAAVKMR